MQSIICNAEISIQGERVFRLVNITTDRVVYEVFGFKHPSVTVIDYRQIGLAAIQKSLRTGNLEEFASEFNTSARCMIQKDDEDNILIELEEVKNEQPAQMLWIVYGLQDTVPIYDYLLEAFAPIDDRFFAFVAVFNIPNLEILDQSSDLRGWEYSK